MTDMTEVTAEVTAERAAADRQRAYAEHQQLASATAALNNAGMTLEQMRAAIQQADAMKRDAAAYTAEQTITRDLEQRQQAAAHAEKASAEAEAHAATFKATQKANWIAGGLGTEHEFERKWDDIRLALFASGKGERAELTDEEYRAKKRREGIYSGI